jgi:DNA modification methylase
VSVWSDIKKTAEERALRHPALFPAELAGRLIDCLCGPEDKTILDPFAGMGSTVIAAAIRGLDGIGLDVSREYVQTARRRLGQLLPQAALRPFDSAQGRPFDSAQGGPCSGFALTGSSPKGQAWKLHQADARRLLDYVEPNSIDLVVTSPPYWNILTRRRSADRKPIRSYSVASAEESGTSSASEQRGELLSEVERGASRTKDLGSLENYEEFLDALEEVFGLVLKCLRPGRFCCAVVMDLRKGGRFYPFHTDLADRMKRIGFVHEDIIIWDRRQEYNNFRPLGYPYVFRVNKAHEYVLIFRKPG